MKVFHGRSGSPIEPLEVRQVTMDSYLVPALTNARRRRKETESLNVATDSLVQFCTGCQNRAIQAAF